MEQIIYSSSGFAQLKHDVDPSLIKEFGLRVTIHMLSTHLDTLRGLHEIGKGSGG